MTSPEHFKRVQASTVDLWNKLKDPVLAGPWRQLFTQVQSPRHVLSELLQNADDSGATTASVRVEKNEFVFEHNGQDFNEEQFQSLCRFGYSNKRNLHTIGFRGVGFKSTFSLGQRVRIQTPTLDVYFERDQFTLPVWSSDATPSACTRISVRFADKLRERQLRMNFEEWAKSPASLLFFRNLQELTVETHTIRKEVMSRGPIAGSQRIRLTGTSTEELLLIRSKEEAFPEEVVNEIRQERNAEDLHLPPCSVELVLGLEGDQQLFVVLPAGTEVEMPFSINAPFLQDPARQKIKEPEVSPCNRWLLDRAGKLAGEAMLSWLDKKNLSAESRAAAYELLRRPVIDAADLTTCATKQVMDSMLGTVEGQPVILTAEEELVPIGECTALPAELHAVWDAKELTKIFARTADHLLSSTVNEDACDALEAHGWIDNVPADVAILALSSQPEIPKPSSWVKLQMLWHWVEENISGDWSGDKRRKLKIVPVEGQVTLHASEEVIRVSSRGQQLSEADWNFISNFALAIDQDWITHANKLKAKNDDRNKTLSLMRVLGMHEPSQVDQIAAQASRRLLSRGKLALADCVRIAHIFASLDATVPEDFQFVTEDLRVRLIRDCSVVFDADGRVGSLVPKEWGSQHVLHEDYMKGSPSCPKERWLQWAHSAKSKLHSFLPIPAESWRYHSRKGLSDFLVSRGGSSPKEYRYKNDTFIVDDFNFSTEVSEGWEQKALENPKLWAELVEGLLLDPLSGWQEALTVTARQISAQSTSSPLSCGQVLPAWVFKLRSLPCLVDMHGVLRTPPELLLRTAETESLLGIEPFVEARLDDNQRKKRLLRLLGVRDSATSWEKVLDRLRGITKIKDTMRVLADVLRLYEALDRIATRCSPQNLSELRAVFAEEPLVLSSSLDWFSSGELSMHADPEDNSPVVHAAIHSLTLWARLGVPDRPALEKSLEWLKTLASGTRLDGASFKRATLALTRGGRRVWDEMGHWMSLDQTWEPTKALKYRVSMRNLTRWEKLSSPTKRAAADLRMLHGEVAEEAPFTTARPLVEAIEMKVTQIQLMTGHPRRTEWLRPLAEALCRAKFADESVTTKVREEARRLLATSWHTVSQLEVTPYIDGTPVGEPLMPKVLWSETKLYASDLPTVRLMRELKDELSRPFGKADVTEAVSDCIDREPEFVREYMAANFELDAKVDSQPPPASPRDAVGEKNDPSPSSTDKNDSEVEADVTEEPDSDENPTNDDDDRPKAKPENEKPPQPKSLSFMDRYAKGRGFRWRDAERCYTHSNGSRIDRGDSPFHWQESVNGTGTIRRFFVVEQSLARGVEIPYELWRLIEINPDSIALVLCSLDGEPNEWNARDLKEFKAAGQLQLHQSRFILRETSA